VRVLCQPNVTLGGIATNHYQLVFGASRWCGVRAIRSRSLCRMPPPFARWYFQATAQLILSGYYEMNPMCF
jgi:hypothetical protein